MAQVAECIDSMNIEVGQNNINQTENTSPIHLLKIDFPLVSQEYQEQCKHYIGTISEKVLDPEGYMTIKTKVDHYLYTVNVTNEIGKPLLNDIVRFPQEILTSFTKNNTDKSDKSQECSSMDFDTNNNFANVQIKSNYKLVRENKRKKQQKLLNRNRKKLKADDCKCCCSDEDTDECVCGSDDYEDYSDEDEEQ